MSETEMHRPPSIITANWKMHKTMAEALPFVEQFIPVVKDSRSKVYLAVPFTLIHPLAQEVLKHESSLVIGAQNMNDASEGAFTGEIAGKMLIEAGAQFVLLGHAERRHLYHETNDFINRKVKRAIEVGLQPVLCVGETEEEREANQTHEVIKNQLTECLKDIPAESLQNLIVAYEPVWAIGHVEAATPEIVQAAHQYCREVLKELLSDSIASQIVIQYGGSVTASNVEALLKQPDVGGLLVGGASLSLDSFSEIVNDSNKL